MNKHLYKLIFSYFEKLSFLDELKYKTRLIFVQTEIMIFYENYAKLNTEHINHKYGIKYLPNKYIWSIFIK